MKRKIKILCLCFVILLAAFFAGGKRAQSEITEKKTSGEREYDLTAMGSDMVYATVYQMMSSPDVYEGKTIRMKGALYSTFHEATGKYRHFCLIQDAMACCSQGVEFVWDDGNHVYPDEYPENNTEIIVRGTVEYYSEDGQTKILYCRLGNASMETVESTE